MIRSATFALGCLVLSAGWRGLLDNVTSTNRGTFLFFGVKGAK
jgi:hypothetical protein